MTKAEFLAKCSQRWDKIENLQQQSSLYELEKDFDEIWTEIGCDILQSSIGKVGNDRRKKKLLSQDMDI